MACAFALVRHRPQPLHYPCAFARHPRTRAQRLVCRASGTSFEAQLKAAKDKIASQQSEIERLSTDLAAALDNVTVARTAAASLDAQRAAAVKSVTRALADKRNEEMAHADALEALQSRVAELEAQLKAR